MCLSAFKEYLVKNILKVSITHNNRNTLKKMAIYLSIPFKFKKAILSYSSARWNENRKLWYIPEFHYFDISLEPWRLNTNPIILKGEDREFGTDRLFIDLIPGSSSRRNARSMIHPSEWEKIRKFVYKRADNRCELCGSMPSSNSNQWLEAHERWSYIDSTQKLERLMSLCNLCHSFTHLDLAKKMKRYESAIKYIKTITRRSTEEIQVEYDLALLLRDERNKIKWKIDISIILDGGIALSRRSRRLPLCKRRRMLPPNKAILVKVDKKIIPKYPSVESKALRMYNDRAMPIQCVLFKKRYWTEPSARKWLRMYNFISSEVEITDKLYRYIQLPEKKYKRFKLVVVVKSPSISLRFGFK